MSSKIQVSHFWFSLRSLLTLFLVGGVSFSQAQNSHPFPYHPNYFKGVIKPYPDQKEKMDNLVRDFFIRWNKTYVKRVFGKNEWYIWKTDSLMHTSDTLSVSEGQGYGMLIEVWMADKKRSSRDIFDGLFRYARSHPSNKSPYLMAWIQKSSLKNKDLSTATDGDLDIAYALLLAHKQWGSLGPVNYLQEALNTIKAIKEQEINPQSYSVMLSNYSVFGGEDITQDRFDMRSSDFMPVVFKAFSRATQDVFWIRVVDHNYSLFQSMQAKWSPEAGLLPDFILHTEKGGRPAGARYLESKYDGKYFYNACRVPWRIGIDYLVNGDNRSKAIVARMNTWIRCTTKERPENISAGYSLQGDDLKGQDYEALSFICPFGVAAMVDARNQAWLNGIWDYSNQFKMGEMDYYDNTLKMLCLIILSGNYWDY